MIHFILQWDFCEVLKTYDLLSKKFLSFNVRKKLLLNHHLIELSAKFRVELNGSFFLTKIHYEVSLNPINL